MEITSVIIKPKLTEKTQLMRNSSKPKMAFFVNPKANKNQIVNAFRLLFGIEPASVNVVKKKPAPTRFMNKSRKNFSKLEKVAYVTVKTEDLENLQNQAMSEVNATTEVPVETNEEEKVEEVKETEETKEK